MNVRSLTDRLLLRAASERIASRSSSEQHGRRSSSERSEPTMPPPGLGGLWSRLGSWSERLESRLSLRMRLTVSVVALMAVVVALLSIVTGVVLRGYLVRGLDQDLQATLERAQIAAGPMTGSIPGYALGRPGQAEGTLAAVISNHRITLAAVLDRRGDQTPLSEADEQALPAAINQKPVGQVFDAAVGSRGEYRFTSTVLPDGDVLLIGIPYGSIDGVMTQYGWMALILGLGVLLVAGGGAFLIGTRLQRTTTRLELALAAREASEARLRRFAADASHELRTPLAAIRGYAELTRRSGARLRSDVAHSLERIESESIRMTGLVEDLLLLARMDEAQPLASEPVELSELAAIAVGDIQVSAPDHDWRVDAPQPVEVRGDPARLHQAIVNLLSNAAKHTPSGTHVVARVRTEGDDAIVEVEDDGPGVPPEVLPDVFGRFVRGDASRARLGAGGPASSSTGLGLAIVQAVATAHGGAASVESGPAHTVFRIRIPRNRP